ncbi:hypothetical protein MLD38_002531 [Melastoma candidum]|uniref:Uncharacterized protein n=1 Tax=Melastoma candidum TaxID=119954 RepID=A0ACB9S3D2_9MYRT|nr:hypothetical protein MLD38_002531 [Melastoma candidum]
MGVKGKKSMRKSLKKASIRVEDHGYDSDAADFLPLEGGPSRKLHRGGPLESDSPLNSTVLYIGRIPHGFYEEEIEGFFGQFGKVRRLRIARNKKTGKSKHFGFIQFESPEVAKIVADTMHNYLLYEHLLQVHLIPQDHVHPNLWKGFNYRFMPVDRVQIQRQQLNKERTLQEQQKLLKSIVKRDKKRQRSIEAAAIDYECPEIVGDLKIVAPKKIKFDNVE